MKSLVIYYSANNNTEKIAVLLAEKMKADIINLKKTKDITIDNYDMIGFGSGVYKERMAPQIFNCVERIDVKNKDVFVFSTSGVGMRYYNKNLIKLLETKGASCRGSFACKGSFNSRDFSNNKIFEFVSRFALGHPNDKDFRKGEEFIQRVISFSTKS